MRGNFIHGTRRIVKTRNSTAASRAHKFPVRFSMSVLVMSIAVMAGTLPDPVLAQTTDVQFSIPAQSLSRSLLQLGEQASLQIFFSQDIVDGHTAPAVSGSLPPEEALRRLLAGTDIQFRRTGNNISLSRPASDGATQLTPVTVRGNYTGALTEGTGAYNANISSAATGLGLSMLETPQSVSVMTRQHMSDQGITSLGEAMDQMTGVYNQKTGTPIGGYADYFSRGYQIESLQVDGVPASPNSWSYYGAASLDTAVYDSITVVRGATGLLTGAGDPSGSISITRKRPTREFQGIAEVGLGSWNQRRVMLDLGGPLNEAGSLRGRFVGAYDHSKSWVDHYRGYKGIAYAVLEADLSDRTTVALTLQHDKEAADAISYDSGLPLLFSDGTLTPGNRRQNTAPDWAYKQDRRTEITAEIAHRLNDDWRAVLTYSHALRDYHDRWYKVYSVSPSYDIDSNWVGMGHSKETRNAFNAHLSGKFEWLGRKHDLIVGLNGANVKRDLMVNTGGAVPGSRFEDGRLQFPNIDWDGFAFNSPFIATTEQLGAYLATRLRVTDDFSVIVGGRWSNWSYSRSGSFNDTRKERDVFTPYAGVVYNLTDTLSAYASYTTIFNPQNNMDRNGDILDPEEGSNYEVGLKSEFFDGRLNVSAALFEVRKDNLAVRDGNYSTPEGGPAYRAEDQTKGRGWELEVAGEVAPGWNMMAGYSRVLSRASDGKQLNTSRPVHQFKLFTTYTPRSMPRLTVGGGVTWQSKIYTTENQPALQDLYTQSGYAIVNLMGTYAFTDQTSLTVNVRNLFDKEYRTRLQYHDYGAPRSIMATLRHQF